MDQKRKSSEIDVKDRANLQRPPDRIQGESVVLCKRSMEQAAEIFDLIDKNREYLGSWLPFPSHTQQLQDTRVYLEGALKRWDERLAFEYSIYTLDNSKLVGSIGVNYLNWVDSSCEVGYWIGEEFQGQGYISESLQLLEGCLLLLGIHRLVIICDRLNFNSSKVAQRNGYEFEAFQIDESKKHGVWRDALRYVKLLNPHQEMRWTENLPHGYSISTESSENFKAITGSLLEDIFSDNELNIWPHQLLTNEESQRLEQLNSSKSKPFNLNLVLWKDDRLAGWTTGRQDSWESYLMTNSAILPEHRGRRLYSSLLKIALVELRARGFQRVWSRHKVTNNRIIIPKLTSGFVISGFTISELAGTLVELSYFISPLRKKVLAFRAGQMRPDSEISQLLKLD